MVVGNCEVMRRAVALLNHRIQVLSVPSPEAAAPTPECMVCLPAGDEDAADVPADFIANRERYAREGAIVFEGIDFFWISLLLWTGQWRALARHYVRLDGPRSDEEVIEMLKGRVQQVKSWPLEAIGVAAA